MIELLIGVIVALLAAVLVLAYELHGMPRLRRRVVINLLGDSRDAIEGVLWTRRGRWIVVKDARLLRANGDIDQADGEILIDRSQIDFVQVL